MGVRLLFYAADPGPSADPFFPAENTPCFFPEKVVI